MANNGIPDTRVLLTTHGVITRYANGKFISSYLDQLKYVYYSKKGMPKRFTLYKITTQRNKTTILILPRDAIAKLLTNSGMMLRNTLPALHHSLVLHAGDELASFLYDDQKIIVSEILRNMTMVAGTASLNLRAGYGKTFIAGGLIHSLGVRTLYVVPTRELAKQTVDDLCAILPSGSIVHYVDASEELARIINGNNDACDACDVCIAVINTVLIASKKCGTSRISNAFSFVVLDEVHTYCSQKRSEIFWITQTNFMFGMSATIGDRRDGFDFAVAHHLPPLIDAEQIRGFSYGENPFTLRIHAIRFKARVDFAQNLRHETTGEIFTHYMYEQFAADEERNELVTHCACELYTRGHNTFIFVEERGHAEKLRDVLRDSSKIPQDEIVLFYGGTSDETRALAIAEKGARIIIATFSYCGTGISIIRMSAIILASPRYSNMKQIIGRILRRGSDTSIARDVIDIVDYRTCLAHQFRIRKNAYDYYNAKYDIQIIKSGEHAAYKIQ
jgi:superfamily II DNA or RNA helicase